MQWCSCKCTVSCVVTRSVFTAHQSLHQKARHPSPCECCWARCCPPNRWECGWRRAGKQHRAGTPWQALAPAWEQVLAAEISWTGWLFQSRRRAWRTWKEPRWGSYHSLRLTPSVHRVGRSMKNLLKLFHLGISFLEMGPGIAVLRVAISSLSPFMAFSHGDTYVFTCAYLFLPSLPLPKDNIHS